MNPIHIVTDKKNIASRVLLPGDPLRAKYIAENYLENAELINTVRNMLGYTGYYKGTKVTVIGSGMGCASVCIYAYELYQIYNVKKIIRIGSAGAFNPNISVGDIVLGSYSFSFSNIRYAMCKSNAKKVSSSNNLNSSQFNLKKALPRQGILRYACTPQLLTSSTIITQPNQSWIFSFT